MTMDPKSRSKKSKGKQPEARAQSRDDNAKQHRLSPEEKCFLAHHVNQCYDLKDLCQMFNMKFNTDRNLESITKFLYNCDDNMFFDLTEQAQDYKWCKPHPDTSPPSMVLGTAEWRTELRAFLVYQASNDVTSTEIQKRISRTFPGESRTSYQIAAQLATINTKQSLVYQLTAFAIRYPWHHEYDPWQGGEVGDTADLQPSQSKSKAEKKAEAKAAAKARLKEGKQKSKDFVNNKFAEAVQGALLE